VYYNGGHASANACDMSAEDLDVLAVVDFMMVGNDPE
jgi:hypothetical protein